MPRSQVRKQRKANWLKRVVTARRESLSLRQYPISICLIFKKLSLQKPFLWQR